MQKEVKPKTEEEKKRIRKRILTGIFIAFNVVIILWTAFSEFGNAKNAAALSSVKINIWLIVPALFAFLIGALAEILKYVLMMKRCCGITDWKTAFRTVLLGRYYDNITPAAVGGQPFQISYMTKHGVKNGYGAMIPITGMISTQMGFLVVAVIAYSVLGHLLDPTTLGAGILGLIFYAIAPFAVFASTFFPGVVISLANICIKFLSKIHIIKDTEAAKTKVEESVKNYANCVRTIFFKDKKLGVLIILLSVLFQVATTSIPFFVIHAFGGTLSYLECFVTILAITAAIYITPTPGNAGFAEGAFFIVFSSLTTGYVFWAMLTWRLFTYYGWIITGVIIYSCIAYEKKHGVHPFVAFLRWSKRKINSIKRKLTK